MLWIGMGANLLATCGILAMGLKYLSAREPLDYHLEILATDAVDPRAATIILALYKVMAGALIGLGAMIGLVTVFGVSADLLWAKFTVLIGAVIAGAAATLVPLSVEKATGARTPWRIAAGLSALAGLGFVLSVL